jgi:hypothetical protein
MKYTTIKNPKYLDASGEYISCLVNFDQLGEVPFVAYKYDNEEHGKEIFNRIVNNEFGEIEAFEPIPIVDPTNEEKASRIRNIRNGYLVELDNLVMNPMRWASFTDEQKNELQNYRQQLLDITDQSTFPESVVWPTRPSLLPSPQTIEISSISF